MVVIATASATKRASNTDQQGGGRNIMGVREFAQPETLGVFDHGVFTWAKVLPMLSQGATDGTSGFARDHPVDRRGANYVEVR